LVVSCPCAFAISVPLTYFSGIGRCSKQGILIKGSAYIDVCAKMNKIMFDKTGTITTGKFAVTKVDAKKGVDKNYLMDIVVAGEKNSLHPIAVAICEYHSKPTKKYKVKDFVEIAGKGIEYKIDGKTYFVCRTKSKIGFTTVEVKEDGKSLGKIQLEDAVKNESKSAIEDIKSLSIKTMMLTGDNSGIASRVADIVGIDDYSAGLLPDDKFAIIESEKNNGNIVGFVGDGLNDAPALAMSNVGISMGIMGSPATIETSDIVIADDNLNQIPRLIKISRKTKGIALGNIIFALVTKLLFLTLGAIGITGMLLAVFADVGVTLIAILNSLRVLMYKTK
jgi:Cd2+/Zn2+-exporting ATPase